MILAHLFAICAISMPFLIFSVRQFNRIHHVNIHIAPEVVVRWLLTLALACFLSYAFCQKLTFLRLSFVALFLFISLVSLLAPLHWGILSPLLRSRLHFLPKPLQRFF
jgi:hypothetical protein